VKTRLIEVTQCASAMAQARWTAAAAVGDPSVPTTIEANMTGRYRTGNVTAPTCWRIPRTS
jgi:hypothetical protein